MRRLLLSTVVATLVATDLLAPTGAGAEARQADVVRLDGVRVELRAGTTQVVTVDHNRGVRARVSLWRLTADGWERQLTTSDGRTGYGGLVDGDRRRQGSGTTPLGTYGLISTFGTHAADPRASLPHHRIRKGDHWVQDNASDFYNQLRNQRDGGFRWWLPKSDPDSSERLTDYPGSTSGRSSPTSTSSRCATAARGSSSTSTGTAPQPAASARRVGSSARWCGSSTPPACR
ncbi:L,D-transpeptidase family protein [Nocardioides sp. P5_E3]